MTTYVLMAALFAALAFASEIWPSRSRLLGWIATISAVLFAGMRFETGHDWLNYTDNFENALPLWDVFRDRASVMLFAQEPVFYTAASVLRSLGANAEVWFFVIAAAGMAGIHFAASRITRNVALVWSVYFGIAFAVGPMMLLRQSVAASLILIGLVLICERRPWPAAGTLVAASGVHLSSLPAFVAFPLVGWRPPLWAVAVILVGGGIVAGFGIDLVDWIFPPVSELVPTQIGFKLAYYAAMEPAPITIGSFVLICMHVGILFVLLGWGDRGDRFVTVGLWLTLGVLAAHLFAFGLPTMWNRVMLVSLPWEVAVFWRVASNIKVPSVLRYATVAGFAAFSTAALVYFLSKPSAIPFVPYQSVVSYWMTGERECGFERLLIAQSMAQKVTAKQISPDLLKGDIIGARQAETPAGAAPATSGEPKSASLKQRTADPKCMAKYQ